MTDANILDPARDAIITALQQYSEDPDVQAAEPEEKLFNLAYALAECSLIAIKTNDLGKAQAHYTMALAIHDAYIDAITPDEEEEE